MRFVRAAALLLTAVTSAGLLVGCDVDRVVPNAGGSEPSPSATPQDPVAITANVGKGETGVAVDKRVRVRASAKFCATRARRRAIARS